MRAPICSILIAPLMLWAGLACANPQPAQPVAVRYSADGLYNLGNSYARAGKPGLAVLSYERAALLAPGDPDINANLAYVRASAHVIVEAQGPIPRLISAMNPTLVAWLGVLGLTLLGSGLVGVKVLGRSRWVARAAIVIGAAQIAVTASNAWLLWPRMHEAVVLVDQAAVRVAPAPMAETAFVLREAQSVTVTAEHQDFILIRTVTGQSGWVSRADIGTVVPDVDRLRKDQL